MKRRTRTRPDHSTVSVPLAGDAEITFAFRGNLFSLSENDRELLANIAGAIDTHTTRNNRENADDYAQALIESAEAAEALEARGQP